MGITSKPIGKKKGYLRKIDNMIEKERQEERRVVKNKKRNEQTVKFGDLYNA